MKASMTFNPVENADGERGVDSLSLLRRILKPRAELRIIPFTWPRNSNQLARGFRAPFPVEQL
jgi:hypothetical protein